MSTKSVILVISFLAYTNCAWTQTTEMDSLRNRLSLLTRRFDSSQKLLALDKGRTFIDLVGNGDIQSSILQGKQVSANTGIGLVFERYNGDGNFIKNYDIEWLINVATTADTIVATFDNNNNVTNRRDFGTYILNPISSKQAIFINSNIYFNNKKYTSWIHSLLGVVSGIQINAIASSSVWKWQDSSCNVGAAIARIGIFHEFLPDDIRIDENGRSKYSLSLGCNFVYDGIFGDLTTLARNSLRMKILNNPDKRFYGWEWTFKAKLGSAD